LLISRAKIFAVALKKKTSSEKGREEEETEENRIGEVEVCKKWENKCIIVAGRLNHIFGWRKAILEGGGGAMAFGIK
jgi:hypothetical protein